MKKRTKRSMSYEEIVAYVEEERLKCLAALNAQTPDRPVITPETIVYRYRDDYGIQGWYQCDRADFLAMFRNRKWREDCYWCEVWNHGGHHDGWHHMWTKRTGWFEPKLNDQIYAEEELQNLETFGGQSYNPPDDINRDN